MVTWRSGALEWAYSRKKVRHSTSPFVVGWTKKMEKRRKQKRPSGKQKEKWSRKCGNIAPTELMCPKNWSDPRSDAISDDLDTTGIELGCRRILNFEKWFGNGGDLPRGDMSPKNHNFPGNLFLDLLLFLASSEVSFGYAPLHILSDYLGYLSVFSVIPRYWCGNSEVTVW